MDIYTVYNDFQKLEGASPFEETGQIQKTGNFADAVYQGTVAEPVWTGNSGGAESLPVGAYQESLTEPVWNGSVEAAENLPAVTYQENAAVPAWDGNSGEMETLPAGAYQESAAQSAMYGGTGEMETLPAGTYQENATESAMYGSIGQMESLPIGAYQENVAEPALNGGVEEIENLPAGAYQTATEYVENAHLVMAGESPAAAYQESATGPVPEESAEAESLPVADVQILVQDMTVQETAGQENTDEQDMDDTDEEQEEQPDEDEDNCENEQEDDTEKSENVPVVDELAGMSDGEIVAESMKRISSATEKITRRNMKECVAEHIQTLCLEDVSFARMTMNPKKSMINCFQYINRKAWDYVQDEMKANGINTGADRQVYGSDVPDELCYQWAEDYFRDPSAKEDEEESPAKPYAVQTAKTAAGKKTEKSGQKSSGKKSVEKKTAETKASEKQAPEKKPGAETQADKKEDGEQLSLFDMMGQKAS